MFFYIYIFFIIEEEIIAVETLFGSSRDSLPPLFISTPYDQQRSLWTKKAPSILILNRITMLAKQSLKLYEDQLFTKVLLDFKTLFRPPITEYDCLIYLKPLMVPRRLQAVDVNDEEPIVEWHPYKRHSAQKVPIVGFDPVQFFLQELRVSFFGDIHIFISFFNMLLIFFLSHFSLEWL